MPKLVKFTVEEQNRIKELFLAGESYLKISKILNVSQPRIKKECIKLGLIRHESRFEIDKVS